MTAPRPRIHAVVDGAPAAGANSTPAPQGPRDELLAFREYLLIHVAP